MISGLMKTGDFFIMEYKFYADLPSSVIRLAYCFSRYAVKKIGVLFITSIEAKSKRSVDLQADTI